MAQATDLTETTPLPTPRNVRIQMEGLAMTVIYAVSFGWLHLMAGDTSLDVKVFAAFLAGLVAIPLGVGLPALLLRRFVGSTIGRPDSVSAIVPFASFAAYGLQGLLVWVATREAYHWVFAAAPPPA